MYQINLNKASTTPEANNCVATDLETWHRRFGYVRERSTRKLIMDNDLSSTYKRFFCKSCMVSKHHRLPYHSIHSSSSFPLDLLYADVWGPAPCLSITGDRFYLLIVDFYSKFNWWFPLKTKSDVRRIFCEFKLMIENMIGRSMKAIQTDNGGEFIALSSYLKENGIVHRRSCPAAHQQMGVVDAATGVLWIQDLLFSTKPTFCFLSGGTPSL